MTEEIREVAAPKEIIRGRMPVAVVYLARFGVHSTEPTKVKADLFGTTVGKVDDIAKNRNFSYVTADFKPTAQQKVDARAWLERHPTGAALIIEELDALEEASVEEAAAFDAVRSAARGQAATTPEGEPVAAGGGNRRKKSKKASDEAAPAEEAPASDADALLA